MPSSVGRRRYGLFSGWDPASSTTGRSQGSLTSSPGASSCGFETERSSAGADEGCGSSAAAALGAGAGFRATGAGCGAEDLAWFALIRARAASSPPDPRARGLTPPLRGAGAAVEPLEPEASSGVLPCSKSSSSCDSSPRAKRRFLGPICATVDPCSSSPSVTQWNCGSPPPDRGRACRTANCHRPCEKPRPVSAPIRKDRWAPQRRPPSPRAQASTRRVHYAPLPHRAGQVTL